MSEVKKMTIAAMCIALSVVLPLAFHSVQNAAAVFCPMHIPVFIAGLITSWSYGLLVGILSPIISAMITGMPNGAHLAPMMVELMAYGLFSGLLSMKIRTKHVYLDLYISLIGAMLLGRIVAGLSRALIFMKGSYAIGVFFTGYFITCWPAILIQLAIIPSLVFGLERANLIPRRYAVKSLSS